MCEWSLGEVRLVLALRAPEDAPAVLPLAVVVEGAAHPAELPHAPRALQPREDARPVVLLDLGAGELLRAVGAVDEWVASLVSMLNLNRYKSSGYKKKLSGS